MSPDDLARLTEEWHNVDQVHELVRQEGDAACERAFDFLLRQVNLARAVVEAARIMRPYLETIREEGLAFGTSDPGEEELLAALNAHDAALRPGARTEAAE